MHEPGSSPVTDRSDQAVRARVKVVYDGGLHARPASVLAQKAREFQADISLVLVSAPEGISTAPGTRADVKSLIELMFLAAACETELEIEASGPDAEAAVEAIRTLPFDDKGPLFG